MVQPDKKGVHFIGLVNVMNLKAGGLGTLGHEHWSGSKMMWSI